MLVEMEVLVLDIDVLVDWLVLEIDVLVLVLDVDVLVD